MRTRLPWSAAALLLLVSAPAAAFDEGKVELLRVLAEIPPDTKAACEESGGTWVVVTDEEKKAVAAYCDLAAAGDGASAWTEAESGTSARAAVSRAKALARFHEGRLSAAKNPTIAARELAAGAKLADAVVARLAAANAADLKIKATDTAAQRRVAVRQEAISAWQGTRVALTRVEEEWRRRLAPAKKG